MRIYHFSFMSDPLTAFDDKYFTLSCFFVVELHLRSELTFVVLLLLILEVSWVTLLGGPL